MAMLGFLAMRSEGEVIGGQQETWSQARARLLCLGPRRGVCPHRKV